MRPHILYAAQRRSNEILCWDVREPLEVLRSFTRKSAGTNQKMLFDIDPAGRWLATGDQVSLSYSSCQPRLNGLFVATGRIYHHV